MPITIRAVYQDGVLRPLEPLSLTEGDTFAVTIARAAAAPQPTRTPEEDAYARRVMAAQSLEDLYAIMATAPPLPADYDLSRALNANREATGERPLFLGPVEGDTP